MSVEFSYETCVSHTTRFPHAFFTKIGYSIFGLLQPNALFARIFRRTRSGDERICFPSLYTCNSLIINVIVEAMEVEPLS